MNLKEIFNKYERPAESRQLACALTFCGGFVDAYTYIQRGHTLSAGQTGNIIFFSSALADHNIAGMINRSSTFIAFSLGLLVVGLFHKYVKGYYWRVFCLFPILAICLIVGFLPRSVPNYYIVPVNDLISYSLINPIMVHKSQLTCFFFTFNHKGITLNS